MYSELLVSQLPMINDYAESARAYFSSSRHPDNMSDIAEASRQSTSELSRWDKAKLIGTTAITFFQQGPFNEIAVGMGVGAALNVTDGNTLAALGAATAITGTAELASSHGMAFALDKLRPAADILGSRYIKQQTPEQIAESKKQAELARIYGEVWIGLSSGATLYEDLRVGGRTPEQNKRTANIASAMVVGNYVAVTGITVGVAKGVEHIFGVEGVTDRLADIIQNPILFGGALGALFGGFKLKERRDTLKRIEAQEVATVQENLIDIPEVQTLPTTEVKQPGLIQRLRNRKAKSSRTAAVTLPTPQEVN